MFQEFNGVRYYKNSITGYWERSNMVYPRKIHQAIWVHTNGPIPRGCAIHHIDWDKDNNCIENLAMLTYSEHSKIHADHLHSESSEEACKSWHSSAEGNTFHSQNGLTTSSRWPTRSYTCEVCGEEFTRKSPRTDYRFCSAVCRSRFRRESKVDDEVRSCAKCGKEFTVNRYQRTICCSRNCAAQLRWDQSGKRSI